MEADRHDELSEAYAELRQEYEIIRDNNDKLSAEYQALAAQLAEAERDAARYRWLRDVRDYSIICERPGNLYLRMPHDLDAAIDAELERKP